MIETAPLPPATTPAPPATVRPGRLATRLKGVAASDHLNLIRGVAALAVVWDHARPQFFQDFRDGSHYSPFTIALYVTSRFGHTAVVVFFVLSGLLVGSAVVDDVGAGRWSWRDYLAKRLTRLYVVLIPAVALTLAADRAWVALTAGRHGPAGSIDITPRFVLEGSTPAVVLGNLAFLQTIAVRTLGCNFALWSLANEFWYYMIFPCLWLAGRGGGGPGRRSALAAAGAAGLAFVGPNIRFYFLLWLIGTVLCFLPPAPWLRGRSRRARAAAAAALLPFAALILLLMFRKLPTEGRGVDSALALTFGFFLYALLHLREPSRVGPYARVAGALAGCSYTLYLVHMPLLVLFRAALTFEAVWPLDFQHALYACAVLLVVLGIAYALSRVTEAKTDAVRRWLLSAARRAGRAPRRTAPSTAAEPPEGAPPEPPPLGLERRDPLPQLRV